MISKHSSLEENSTSLPAIICRLYYVANYRQVYNDAPYQLTPCTVDANTFEAQVSGLFLSARQETLTWNSQYAANKATAQLGLPQTTVPERAQTGFSGTET